SDFVRIVLQRTGLNSTVYGYDESVPFWLLAKLYGRRIYQNMPLLFFLLSVAEIILLIRDRRPLLPALYIGFLVYAVGLRNFVAARHFPFLPFFSFVITAVMSFAARIPSLVSAAANSVGRVFRSAKTDPQLESVWRRWLSPCVAGVLLGCFAIGLW